MSEQDNGQSEQRDLQAARHEIAFGLDCEKFMRSPIGKYLISKANADIDEATEALKTVNAEDPKEIRRLQNDVAAAERFLHWMGEAVTAGENAQSTYIEAQG